VRQLKAAGYGGFFMHPRVGLETEYLSDEWFAKIGACVDEAGKRACWPGCTMKISGPAASPEDGSTASSPRLAASHWSGRRSAGSDGRGFVGTRDPGGLAIGKDDKGAISSSRRLKAGDQPNAGEAVIRFRTQPFVNENWYNGEAYLDILNPEAVHKFLDLTMEATTAGFGPTTAGRSRHFHR